VEHVVQFLEANQLSVYSAVFKEHGLDGVCFFGEGMTDEILTELGVKAVHRNKMKQLFNATFLGKSVYYHWLLTLTGAFHCLLDLLMCLHDIVCRGCVLIVCFHYFRSQHICVSE
jgi:hypothetical protein